MKIIQTLFIDDSKNPFKDGCGWIKPEYHLMSWALSCLLLREKYVNLELFVNSNAGKLLIDTLGLPYSEVHYDHDKLSLPHNNLWALPKIYTYSLQENPFLHIDGDVFIFNRINESLLDSELIAQNIEIATEYYLSTLSELKEHFTYFPNCVIKDFNSSFPFKAVNAGILGGKNIQFFKEYSREAFEYVYQNLSHMPYINVNRFNVFFEQHLFYSLANEKEIPISIYLTESINDNEYLNFGNFHEVPGSRSYLHLLGDYKRDEPTCLKMAAKLRELYPDYYYKIISICRANKMPLATVLYSLEKIDWENDFGNIQNKSKEIYFSGIKKPVQSHIFVNEFVDEEFPDLCLIRGIFNDTIENLININDKDIFTADFASFADKLREVIKKNILISDYYLYGRDLASTNWYNEIFGNEYDLPNKVIMLCEDFIIIESEFDWAALINKYKRVDVKYYLNLQVTQGKFFNLIIPEVYIQKYSIYEIDEIEKLLIEHLNNPMSVKNLLFEMQCYFEDDVIQNSKVIYTEFIVGIIKELVIKKAIKPFSLSNK